MQQNFTHSMRMFCTPTSVVLVVYLTTQRESSLIRMKHFWVKKSTEYGFLKSPAVSNSSFAVWLEKLMYD
jgi:hypothetical protein